MPTEEITIEDLVNWYCEYYNIELWKDIEGYEGLYQVSNTGKVKSLEKKVKSGDRLITKPERILTQQKRGGRTGNCYLCVDLWENNKMKMFSVHKLVALAFVPNPNNYIQVNHIDECKANNNAANLEWCDCKYNQNWGTRNARISKTKTNHKSTSKTVLQYTRDGVFVAEYPSVNEVERVLGFDEGHISACCIGKKGYKTSYGYVWKYKGEAV